MPLVKDGDVVAIIQHIIHARGQGAVGVTEVKGHATEADVDQGLVRFEDRLGNAETDTAADLGRRHQPEAVMDARRALLNAREVWYPVIPQKHRTRSPCLGSCQESEKAAQG